MVLFLKKYLDGKYNDDDADMIRDKILLQRRVNPKKVNLPDEQTFTLDTKECAEKTYLKT